LMDGHRRGFPPQLSTTAHRCAGRGPAANAELDDNSSQHSSDISFAARVLAIHNPFTSFAMKGSSETEPRRSTGQLGRCMTPRWRTR
ncbi:hypothetical protein, partial [Burkholderia sp. LMG 13014]|uniref:hypothetical protein n=1 Tax=Burkholderia sp. LMG 13014 TaxID=2709306 RepID=UPI0019627F27